MDNILKNGGKILVDQEFSIERDPHNFVVVQQIECKGKHSKKSHREERSYHATLLQACNRVLNLSLKGNNVEGVIKSIEESTAMICEAIDKARP